MRERNILIERGLHFIHGPLWAGFDVQHSSSPNGVLRKPGVQRCENDGYARNFTWNINIVLLLLLLLLLF